MAGTNPEAEHSGVDPVDPTPVQHLDTGWTLKMTETAGDTGFRTGHIATSAPKSDA